MSREDALAILLDRLLTVDKDVHLYAAQQGVETPYHLESLKAAAEVAREAGGIA